MRPWVIWLLQHRMRWLVLTLLIITSPVQFAVGIVAAVRNAIRNNAGYLTDAWREIKEWKP